MERNLALGGLEQAPGEGGGAMSSWGKSEANSRSMLKFSFFTASSRRRFGLGAARNKGGEGSIDPSMVQAGGHTFPQLLPGDLNGFY